MKFTIILCLCCFASQLMSQRSQDIYTPRVGDTLPEYTFTDLRNHASDRLSLSELRGKWLIIDFWSKDCSGCLKSFPKMNELHKKFKDSLKILMVGNVGDFRFESGKTVKREKATKQLYERLERLYDLKFTVSFDSLLENTYGIRYLPYILVVDPNGIIRDITSSLNEEAVSGFLAGSRPRLNRAYTGTEWDQFENDYDPEKLSLSRQKNKSLPANLGLFRSVLSHYDRATMTMKGAIDLKDPHSQTTQRALNDGIFETNGAGIKSLFYIAYFGVTFWHADNPHYYQNFSKEFIFETNDSLLFLKPDTAEYAYSLIVPRERANAKYFKKVMQKDLEVYFGLKGRVEKRPMPVYYLTVSDLEKATQLLSVRKNNRYIMDDKLPELNQIILNDGTMEQLCNIIGGFTGTRFPILNKTGFVENIDIDLHAYIYDLNEIKKALEKHGLTLEMGIKELNTIIISDSEGFK